MTALTALLVDDEPLARLRLGELLKSFPEVRVLGEAENGEQALIRIEQLRPDVVFLDIRMPGVDGLAVARTLAHQPDAPAVVFCTAFDEHALAAFDAQAVDYLVKPLKRERLGAALQRVQRILGRDLTSSEPQGAPFGRTRSHLSVRVRGQVKLIPLPEVIFLLADTKYTEIHTANGTLLLEESLVSLEEEFPALFLRIHRNCLVAKHWIVGLQKLPSGETQVNVKLGRDRTLGLDVSRRNLAMVKKQLAIL